MNEKDETRELNVSKVQGDGPAGVTEEVKFEDQEGAVADNELLQEQEDANGADPHHKDSQSQNSAQYEPASLRSADTNSIDQDINTWNRTYHDTDIDDYSLVKEDLKEVRPSVLVWLTFILLIAVLALAVAWGLRMTWVGLATIVLLAAAAALSIIALWPRGISRK